MSNTTKWFSLGCQLIAALVCYGIGLSQAASTFLVIGVLFEMSFWFGVFKLSPSFSPR